MRDDVIDILLRLGIPAGSKGFCYIHDAMELLDEDPYYISGKIGCLYGKVAKHRQATPAQVERSIRHAFETSIAEGNRDAVEHYLDLANTQNSNLLRTLHLRWKQDEHRRESSQRSCGRTECAYREQMYQEALNKVSAGVYEVFIRAVGLRKEKGQAPE
jgi:two-component system response regulator (stage 0 sporulation protein A)